MNGIHGLYQNSYHGSNMTRAEGKKSATEANNAKDAAFGTKAAAYEKSEEATGVGQKQQVELSERAQKLLEKLKEKYGDTDFVIANYSSESEAQRLLAGGTKEFSVLIEPELLEEMAADEAVLEKYEGILKDSKAQIEDMVEQLGPDADKVSSLGVAINKDGEVSFFAELDKVNEKQRERIEKNREEKKKAAKEEHVASEQKIPGRKVRVYADSVEELLERIRKVDLEQKENPEQSMVGKRIDYSV